MKTEQENQYSIRHKGFPYDIFTIPTDLFYALNKSNQNCPNRLSFHPSDHSTSEGSDDDCCYDESSRHSQSNHCEYANHCINNTIRFTSLLTPNWCYSIKEAHIKSQFLFKYLLLGYETEL